MVRVGASAVEGRGAIFDWELGDEELCHSGHLKVCSDSRRTYTLGCSATSPWTGEDVRHSRSTVIRPYLSYFSVTSFSTNSE